jgi:hypothetical protein
MDARWKPVAVSDLRIGQYLRIGHRWFDHPFVLGTFRITSDSEISIIREAQLTRLFIDPDRSVAETSNGVMTDQVATTGINELEAVSDIIAYSARLQDEKAAHAETVHRQRRLFEQVQLNYDNAVGDSTEVQRLLGEGDVDATSRATALVNRVLQAGEDCDCPLSFAAADQPVDPAQRLSRQSLDAVAIAGVVGRKMNLGKAEMSILALSALAHGVGIDRLPEALRDESLIVARGDLLEYQHYPILSARILRGCDGSCLELTDGSIGRVIRVSESDRMRPTVCLFDDTVSPAEADIVNLATTRSIRVQRVLDPQGLERSVIDFFGGDRWSGLTLSNPSLPA